MEFLVLFAWLGSVLYGPYIASQKRRSQVEGFCLAAFLGPFGLVIEALLPTVEPPPEEPRRKRLPLLKPQSSPQEEAR